MKINALLAIGAGLWFAACASAPPPSPASPEQPPSGAPEAAPPSAAAEPAQTIAAPIPPPPDECRRYAEPATECGASAPLATALAEALELSDVPARDRALACVEQANPKSVALLRALRADLLPTACADVLVTPILESGGTLAAEDENTLLGLLIAARLSRLVGPPPTLEGTFDKQGFMSFFEEKLKPWMVGQAVTIGRLALEASRLQGYGRAVGAIEAGLSDFRFVQVVRAVPLPTELASDEEARNVYYATLDEALEPRKARGRDAALVGLRYFSELGALSDPRVTRARALLSELYAGSRVDALDRVLLPEAPAPLAASTVESRLAARLPTYYAGRLVEAVPGLAAPAALRSYVDVGVPLPVRTQLDRTTLDANASFLYALAEARRGAFYVSAAAYGTVTRLLSAPTTEAAELLGGIATALQTGPKDAAELMMASPKKPFSRIGSLEPLERLATRGRRYRGEALFNAAYLRFLAPPENDPKFWEDLGRRFSLAERALTAAAHRELARDLADSARKTAGALRAPSPRP